MKRAKSQSRNHELPPPKVGIFWVVRGELVILGTPVSDGEGYGENAIYGPSHYDKWRELQQNGVVPQECEYEEFPRGRVMFNRSTQTYLLLADGCILANKRLLGQIMAEMHLPRKRTVMDADSHYRCFRCLGLV
jgi:hypothetical protein